MRTTSSWCPAPSPTTHCSRPSPPSSPRRRWPRSSSSTLLSLLVAHMVILSLISPAAAVEDFVRNKRSDQGQDDAVRPMNRFHQQPRSNSDVGQAVTQAPDQNVGNSVNNNINNNNNDNNNLPAVDAPLQKILEKHKEKTAEETRRTEEIKKQIDEHEKKMAARQQQMEEREKQRREREKVLNEQRQQAERIQQQQRERDGQERARNDPKEREREQAWVLDVQRKSQEKLAQKQQQQVPLVGDAARQPSHVAGNQPDPWQNAKDIHSGYQPQAKSAGANTDTGRAGHAVLDSNAGAGIVVNKTYRLSDNVQVGPRDTDRQSAKAESRNQIDVDTSGNNVPDVKQRAFNNEISNADLVKPADPNIGVQERADPGNVDRNQGDKNYNNQNNILGIPLNGVNSNNFNEMNRNGDSNGLNNAGNDNNFNNNNNNNFNNNNEMGNIQTQPAPQSPQIGRINLSWDWEDFSIMFNNYGAAEMKVRRSPHPTTGEPWPMPQYYSKKDNKVYKVSKDFRFIPTGVMCDVLEEGMARHLQRILRGSVEDMYDNLQNAEGTFIDDPVLRYEKDEFLKAPVISRVEIKVRKPCDKYPTLESDESYDLVVKKKKTYIWANEVWGALRGLETLGHLVWKGTDSYLYIKETVISDYPRFPHRGIHMDTSRHFLFKEVILDILESMEMNKLNVLHWHIVDDQSFPYESKVYPELSHKGAFHPSYVYTHEDIADIIEYARLRGIRVMPEFDTPGHTYAWGLSRPELLTQCYTGNIPVKGYLGPIDPSKNATYRFLQTLFQEVMDVFKDQYLHLGGDEVPLGCWQSNPEVMAFAQELARKARTDSQQSQQFNNNNNNFGGWSMWSDEIRKVYEYYENRLIAILNDIGQKRKKGIKYIMWQEVINNNLQLPNDTIIQVWMGDMGDVMRATSMGYQVLYSTCWYMDHIEYGTKWPKYYNCDPVDQSYGYHIDEKKVLGGEAAFWSEYFSNENLIALMWPRASAAAERLWSHKDVKNVDKAAERLAEHRCRMIKRGINAGEISGPGYCLHAPAKRRSFNDTMGCKGGNCSRPHSFVQIEDIELHVSQRGGSLADCGNVFTRGGGNIFIMLTLALVVVAALYALSRTSSRFHRIRICKNRSILIVFVVVLLVYFLCYTTIWMRAFEFSGSFHKTLQEDNRSGASGGEEESINEEPVNS